MDLTEFNDRVGNLSQGRYAGLPIAPVPDEEDTEVPAAGETAWRLSVATYDAEETFEEQFTRFLEKVDASAVKAIIIGEWEDAYEESSAMIVRLLLDNADRFPQLRSVFLGAMEGEECEISWIKQADVTPLLEAFPLLERLEVRGGDGLELRPVRHEALRVLRFESGGLPAGVVRAVGACDLPALEYLEVWLGVEQYGGDARVTDLQGILSGERLPALRHLGLQDSEIQDEIAAAVAGAPVVARLEALSLAMGTLTDAGAEALLSGQPLTHLKRLDLHHHYLTDAMAARVRAALPGTGIDLSDQEDIDNDWRYVAVSE
ncbi:STM4015 family protein [Planomonospora sp. ID67723]|uniref:STM4015 family protein n=1 Tax=Planomonospora sp. ID67723 TaxID=2738134 RepID=UPI0018C40357|nr:STM4015 family protein [Planomonospora sp. ID67723]MBG0829855.1 STM4015 family protein [Planomonospora sp. ID67723]